MLRNVMGAGAIVAVAALAWNATTVGAQAEFITYIEQVGSNVVVTGSGTLDWAGLTWLGPLG